MLGILSAIGSVLSGALKAIPAGFAWCKRHPVATPWIVSGVLAALLAWSWWPRPAPAAPHGTASEAAAGQQAGGTVVQQASPERLTADEKALLAEVPALRDAKAALEAKVGKLEALAILRGKGSGTAHGKERPGEPAYRPTSGPVPPVVLLRDGDHLTLSLNGGAYRAPQGTEFLLVPMRATRDSDGEVLSEQLLSVPWTEAVRKADPAPAAPRVLRLGLAGGGVAGGGGASWVVGGQALYRERLTLTVVGGPGPDRKGIGLAVAGFLF